MTTSTREKFLDRVEAFLARHGISATRLGIQACSDPNFVHELRHGRSPRLDLMDRVDLYMRERDDDASTSRRVA